MITRRPLIIHVAFAVCLLGCATPYQPRSFRGGFSDTQLAPDLFRVYFKGNGHTSMERAQDLVLLRAAELAEEHGFSCFAVVDESSSTSAHAITTEGQSYTSGSAFATGSTATYSGHTTYYPGQTYVVYKPLSGLVIKCFVVKPEGVYTFDVAFLKQSLKQKYKLD